MSSRVVFAITLAAAGCASAPPTASPEAGAPGSNAGFADLVVSLESDGQAVACDPTAGCAELPACPGAAALGGRDGRSLTLAPGDQVALGFRCAFILSHGDVPDFTIWSSVGAGASALVEVSADGAGYAPLDELTASNQTFSLSRVGAGLARFVRLTNTGAAAIAVDAVQAL